MAISRMIGFEESFDKEMEARISSINGDGLEGLMVAMQLDETTTLAELFGAIVLNTVVGMPMELAKAPMAELVNDEQSTSMFKKLFDNFIKECESNVQEFKAV